MWTYKPTYPSDDSQDTTTFFDFGFITCEEYYGVGCIEHTRLGATRYYINVSTLEAKKWREVSRDEWHQHLRPIA